MASHEIQSRTSLQRARNEKGFAILGLSLISLLFFSAVLFISFFTAIIQSEQRIKKNCISLSWQHQENQKKNLEKILQLNPQALALRKRWQLAQVRLAKAIASGNPVLITAAKTHLLAIYIKKCQLATRQKSILLRAGFESEMFKNSLRVKIHTPSVETYPGGLAVEPELPLELASPYRPLNLFSQRQLSGAQWENRIHKLIPSAFLTLAKQILPLQSTLDKKISGQCFVTIERRSTRWFVTLTAAKS